MEKEVKFDKVGFEDSRSKKAEMTQARGNFELEGEMGVNVQVCQSSTCNSRCII